MTDCPVCGRTGLDTAWSECPQCNADLECFQLLDTLSRGETQQALHTTVAIHTPTNSVTTNKTDWKPNTRKIVILVAVVLLLLEILIGVALYRYLLLQEADRTASTTQWQQLSQRVIHVEQRLSRLLTVLPLTTGYTSKKISATKKTPMVTEKELSEKLSHVEQLLLKLLVHQADTPMQSGPTDDEKLLLRSSRRLIRTLIDTEPLD